MWNDRAQIDMNSGVHAARKKLLENLYEGENATKMVSDVAESEQAAESRATRTDAPAPRQVRRRQDEQQTPEGEQQGAFGPTMFNAFSAGGAAPPQTSAAPGAARALPAESRPQGSAPPTGANLANRQNEINRLLTIPANAAMKFMQIAVPGARGGPPVGFQGGAWKNYQDTSGNPPAQRDTGYLTPPASPWVPDESPVGGGGVSPLPPMSGNPSGIGFTPVSNGGNNVRPTNLPTGNGYVQFRNQQSAAGSNRIQVGQLNGRPVFRFQVNPGDSASNGNRAELIGPSNISAGQTKTYSMQLFVPGDFVGPQWGTFLQFHSPDANPNSQGVNNWGLHFHGETLGIYDNSGTFHPIQNVKKGAWSDFEMTVKFGTGSSGRVTLKIDGKQVFDKAVNTIDNAGSWYLKQGYYRKDTGTTGVLYSTPVREGASQGTGGLGNPVGNIGGTPASGNKMPAQQALSAVNNTPQIWSTSFEGNRKMHRITDLLFQSGQPLSGTDAFAKAGFDLVVNTRNNNKYAGVTTLNVPLNDAKPTQSELNAAMNVAKQVADAIRAGKRVLVHCYAGANRSGLVNALALIQLGYGRQQALDMVRAGRPGAVSNTYFEKYILTGSI